MYLSPDDVNNERLNELAADFASGEITAAEQSELRAALAAAHPADTAQTARIVDTAAMLAMSIPPEKPGPALKSRILERIRTPGRGPALDFIHLASEGGWTPMRVPGAYVKLLSMNKEQGYSVALGKLDPKANYPAHTHLGAEDILVLSGDLSIGTTRLQAGDFHHADAGSRHDINRSEDGCTILIVISNEDLMAQMA